MWLWALALLQPRGDLIVKQIGPRSTVRHTFAKGKLFTVACRHRTESLRGRGIVISRQIC